MSCPDCTLTPIQIHQPHLWLVNDLIQRHLIWGTYEKIKGDIKVEDSSRNTLAILYSFFYPLYSLSQPAAS